MRLQFRERLYLKHKVESYWTHPMSTSGTWTLTSDWTLGSTLGAVFIRFVLLLVFMELNSGRRPHSCVRWLVLFPWVSFFSRGLLSARFLDRASLPGGPEEVMQEVRQKTLSSSGLLRNHSLFFHILLSKANCLMHSSCMGMVTGSTSSWEESHQSGADRWAGRYFFHLPLCSACSSNGSVFLDRKA